MTPADLIGHAQRLAKPGRGRPYQADLKRAVSAAYYALFHAVARTAADTLIGATAAHRSSPTWARAYRSLEHRYAKNQCKAVASYIPAALNDVADAFVQLQELREEADYNPLSALTRRDVEAHIRLAEAAISSLDAAAITDRRAFAAWLIFKNRS
jgi:hypothetical protein